MYHACNACKDGLNGRLRMQLGSIDGAIGAFSEMGCPYPVIRQKVIARHGASQTLVEQRMALLGIRP